MIKVTFFGEEFFILELDNSVEDFCKLQNFLDEDCFFNGTITKLPEIRLS
jgi:hypothetical protein